MERIISIFLVKKKNEKSEPRKKKQLDSKTPKY